MHTLQNKCLQIGVEAKGAELKFVRQRQTAVEYIWSGDPQVWAKTSPVLFPIVGTLKENHFRYQGKDYTLPRHGFARDKTFTVVPIDEKRLRFELESDPETRKVYPFDFLFALDYQLEENTLTVTYTVENRGEGDMLFSVGGHPAFRLPLVAGTTYDDYFLTFEKVETAPRWPISKEGLIEKLPQPLLLNAQRLPLTKALFQKDAIVLKHLQSTFLDLQSDKTPHGFRFSFSGFPYLGLWAAPNADFLCIEPWCGIADSVDAEGQLNTKEGIVNLPAGEMFRRSWSVKFY